MARETSAATLTFWPLLALGVNGIVGVGIFFAPREVAALVPGAAGLWVYILTGLVLLPIAGVYAVLGSRFAEDGGPYVWARAAFGEGAGFFVGWIAALSAVLSTSAVVSGLATHAGPLLGLTTPLHQALFGVALALVLSGIVFSGLKPSAVVWSGLTVLKLAPLAALAFFFLTRSGLSVAVESAQPSRALLRAMLVVLFALQGFEIVVVPAGNAPKRGRSVAAATLLSLCCVAALYVVLHAACLAVPQLAQKGAPLVEAASVHGGSSLSGVVGVGTNVSALGIAFGMFAMTPRYLAALGKPHALGTWLGRESERRVPTTALGITMIVVMILVFGPKLEQLFVLSSVSVVLQYTVSTIALMWLALKRVRGLSLKHLWFGPFAILPVGLAATAASGRELLVTGAALVLGASIYWIRRIYARNSRP